MKKTKSKRNKLFQRRSDLLADVQEVSTSEMADALPEFKNDFNSNEMRKIKLHNVELFNGFKGSKRERIRNVNLGEPTYGTTYETNLPEQAYTFEYPSFEYGTFNPLQMHLTGRANYDRLKKGGTLPLTPLPEQFTPSRLIRSKTRRR